MKHLNNFSQFNTLISKFGLIFTLLIIPFCLASCGDDNEPESNSNHDPALIGTWFHLSEGISGEDSDVRMEIIYTFNANGNCSMKTHAYKDNNLSFSYEDYGTWSTSGNVLTLETRTEPHQPPLTEQMSYAVAGDILTLDGTMTFKRK